MPAVLTTTRLRCEARWQADQFVPRRLEQLLCSPIAVFEYRIGLSGVRQQRERRIVQRSLGFDGAELGRQQVLTGPAPVTAAAQLHVLDHERRIGLKSHGRTIVKVVENAVNAKDVLPDAV